MAYFPDLSIHKYTKNAEEIGFLNIGWLEKGKAFNKGKAKEDFVNKLMEVCSKPIHLHRGFHYCDFCFINKARGNGQIRILSIDGIWYVAPTLIYHYVIAHKYLPPSDFIDAVISPKEIAKG